MPRKWIHLSVLIPLLAASPASVLANPLSLPETALPQVEERMTPAATLTVNTAIDENDGSCADGDCSLRDAIAAASTGDRINFAGDYTITLSSTLVIDTALTIDGSGHAVTVSGNDSVRVFSVSTGADLTIDSLTIADGNTTAPDFIVGHASGGGMVIATGAVVTLTNSAVLGNAASSYISAWDRDTGMGGGIFNQGTLTVIETIFAGNSAGDIAGYTDSYGGAIDNRGSLAVQGCTFTGNSGARGGAIYHESSSALTVQNSLFSNNSAPCGGGGIMNTSTAAVSGSTISGNTAPGDWCDGGAAGIANRYGTMTVTRSTISENVSEINPGGLSNYAGSLTVIDSVISNNSGGRHGGGIYNWWGADLTVINSEIYSNTTILWGAASSTVPMKVHH